MTKSGSAKIRKVINRYNSSVGIFLELGNSGNPLVLAEQGLLHSHDSYLSAFLIHMLVECVLDLECLFARSRWEPVLEGP